ncbi:MAG TPA: MBOAT family O-acyltransferase [Pseudomonadales bacterium]|nr:MBOAT family O-acyltransferase [Pseudomonadales bacterium]
MLFNSYAFLLLFLPVACAGHHWLCRSNRREMALLWLNLCSLFFYAWWNPACLPLLLLSISGNFYLGKQLSRQQGSTYAKSLLALGISLNLAVLAYFKYTGFALENINAFLGTSFHAPDIVLPLAISFFTFNQIAYLVDAAEGMTEEYSFNHYTLFVSFFPHLLAGPIVHHRELIPQFFKLQDDALRQQQWAVGITAISFGLFKKVIFADATGYYADQVFRSPAEGNPLSMIDAWIGALTFNLHVYFDFSGYCDIAYGTALLFGIVLPQNFLSPFKAANIIDFWKNWHITLSRFITSYVYTPLIRNTPGGVVFSKAMLVTLVSMGIAGLWHGAGWTFIAYGLAHGSLLVINHCWRKVKPAKKLASIPAFRIFSIVLTYTAVTLTMVLFRSPDLTTAIKIFNVMFNVDGFTLTHHLHQPVISDLCRQLKWDLSPMQKLLPVLLLLHAWIWFLPNLQQIMGNHPYALCNTRLAPTRLLWQPNTFWSVCTALALTASVMALYETGVFLYFRF